MKKRQSGVDPLFLMAERQAMDFSLFPPADKTDEAPLRGVLSPAEVEQRVTELRALDVDAYVAAVVQPSEDQARVGARWVIRRLGGEIVSETDLGPLFAAEMRLDPGDGTPRPIGILAQERRRRNGVWLPEHHRKAVEIIRGFATRSLPIVTFMDTPGADAGEQSNRSNQAHAISRLIAEFAQLDVPTVGIVLGNGYSGGAIPLATVNILLSVRDGVFNTIQPRGLASIARKYDLSWQECARYVGVSSYELLQEGLLDGIIDFVPGELDTVHRVALAIGSAILAVERAAGRFVAQTPEVFEHYRRHVFRYLEPSDPLRKLQAAPLTLYHNPTDQPNIFGLAYRHLRYLGLRRRLRSTTRGRYGRLSAQDVPRGDLRRRVQEEYHRIFRNWLEHPLELRYDEALTTAWKDYRKRRVELLAGRGRLSRIIFGDPGDHFRTAYHNLLLVYGFHLLNSWKGAAQANFASLADHLAGVETADADILEDPTVMDILRHQELRDLFREECANFLIFDLLYDHLISDMRRIAREAKDTSELPRETVRRLFADTLQRAVNDLAARKALPADGEDARQALLDRFMDWAGRFARHGQRDALLKKVEEWKKIVFPRVSEPLFAIITFYFGRLLPAHFGEERGRGRYDGRIRPRNIGVHDFWNRLTMAYQDLLIHEVLQRLKKERPITSAMLRERFFTDFRETDADLMSADPAHFPGFRASIEEALARDITPCGAITGTARLRALPDAGRVGVVVSNLEFQAGAFDMAGAEKFCRLLVECARRRYPVIAFISSGGMQTKEGAGALFPMAILNDRITRFVRETGLPVLCFGFGDCTGGAQASFVTHPLAQTYYFSGTNMPFAGQIVVPEHLTCTATLSNYLSQVNAAMDGLVVHPFHDGLDESLKAIDPAIPVPRETVEEVIDRVLRLELEAAAEEPVTGVAQREAPAAGPFQRVLVHARGCAAEKIVRRAQAGGLEVVLVQSDADMNSPAAALLRPGTDQLVCLGGNTPAESYLNAMSIIRVAERTGAQALHPGIGFLSENAGFARVCRAHGLIFIGPPAEAMERMGNKSNAIHTAKELGIPVVPGSHGIVTHPEAAAALAEQIGYPVIIKAVHGGGGKGIAVVERAEDFIEAFHRIGAEARSAFGNGDVYLERFIRSLRHVEVQILRDTHGNTRVLGLRDCSVQRNNQKVIEESASTRLPAALEATVLEAAGRIADAIGYTGAGTVEFIYDLDRDAVYFMEMNTRLQVEHPVTERVTGVDIVGWQFRIAMGESLADMPAPGPVKSGWAMELRINAERAVEGSDGSLSFLPCPGPVHEFRFPPAEGIDLIRAVDEGKAVTPFYDSMIVQLIAHAPDREKVIRLLRGYLDKVTIRGVCTNIPLLKRILDDKTFRAGKYDTTYLRAFTQRLDAAALALEMETAAGLDNRVVDLDALRIPGTDELKVPAPSAGVFYRSSAPGEPEFVQPGDVIDSERTIGLLEAMKNFRPLTLATYKAGDGPLYPPDSSYEVVRVVAENAQAVNEGDLLMVIRGERVKG